MTAEATRAEINVVDTQDWRRILMHRPFEKEKNNAAIQCLSTTDTDSGCRPMHLAFSL